MKGVGEMGVNIFLREAQAAWEEVYPFADKRTLDMAKQRGLPSKSAKELAEQCGDDRYCIVLSFNSTQCPCLHPVLKTLRHARLQAEQQCGFAEGCLMKDSNM